MHYLLDSIALQQGIDFTDIGVIIVNDGSNCILSQKFLKKYPFQILYFWNLHGGLSKTRNKCLDYATAEYVMFCDADDMFCDLCALHRIFLELNGCDAIVSKFIEESRIGDDPVYISHERDGTYVHGKIYRRQFLINNEIRFCDRLLIHEDGFFNQIACMLAEDLRYIEQPFYIWRWNPNSITRNRLEWALATYPELIDGNDALADELERRGLDAEDHIKWMILDAYKNRSKLTDEAKARFVQYVRKHEKYTEDAPAPLKDWLKEVLT